MTSSGWILSGLSCPKCGERFEAYYAAVLRKNSIRPDTVQYPLAQLRKFSAKGRYRSESVRDRWSPTSDTGERGTDRTLPLLRRVREFPYIGMEPGVRQALQSV